MQPDQEPATITYWSAFWLTSIAWTLLVLGGLGVFLLWGGPAMIAPLLLPLVAGLGRPLTCLALRSFDRGKQKQGGCTC